MSQDQSLAVIDATDAQVLGPDVGERVMDVREREVLDKCQHHLSKLGRRIASKELDLVYLYVEAGWWLLRAHAVHHVCHRGTPGENGRFVAGRDHDGGFRLWLENEAGGIPHRTAYRWMQGAQNAGLTADSNILALQTLKAEKKLHGQTLTALCRRPVDTTDKQFKLHELTDAEALQLDNEERLERWTKFGEFAQQEGLEKEDWSHMDFEPRKAVYDLITELANRMRPSLKKLVGDKSLGVEVGMKKRRKVPSRN